MAHLSIYSLGPFRVMLDGDLVTEFESNKVRALLFYLAVESDHPHSREALAGFLWPNQPERTARHNLRQTLSNLRQAIRDHSAKLPFLKITRLALQAAAEQVGIFLHGVYFVPLTGLSSTASGEQDPPNTTTELLAGERNKSIHR